MRAVALEAAVRGRPWEPAWLPDVETLLARDFTPIGDHRGGAAYRLRAAAEPLAPLPVRDLLERAGAGRRAMNEPLARIRGGVHAAARHDSAVGHVTGAARYIDDVPTVTGDAGSGAGAEPPCACPYPPHRSLSRARRARRRSPRSRPPTFPARTTSPRSAVTSRHWPPTSSSTRASRLRPSPRAHSIRRGWPRGWSKSTMSRCPPS